MPEGVDIEVETVDLDNQVADAPMRSKRFLFGSALFRVGTIHYKKMTITGLIIRKILKWQSGMDIKFYIVFDTDYCIKRYMLHTRANM